MKDTETLVLTKGRLFWHYSIIPFLLLVPVLTTIDVFKFYVTNTYSGTRPIEDLVTTGYVWLIPALIFYFVQKRRLRFKVIEVRVDADNFKQAAERTAKELEWRIEYQTNDFVVAHRDWNWTGSWGEMITIIRDKDKVLINSICDPDNRPSVASFGMNKLNIKTFEKELNKLRLTTSFMPEGIDSHT